MDETDRPGSKSRPTLQGAGDGDASAEDRYTASLRAFFEEVCAVLEELKHEVPGATVSMKKAPDQILSMLPQLLRFEQMSLLELQYTLPGTPKYRPGIRFWLEGPLHRKRLRAVLFRDTRVWDVSYDLEKLYTELGSFSLCGGGIAPHPAPALPGNPAASSDWKALLRDLLHAPVTCP
jgi:hypothetical protein